MSPVAQPGPDEKAAGDRAALPSPAAEDGLSGRAASPLPPATTRSVVDQARGVLMGCYGCDARTASAMLARLAAKTHAELHDVAVTVVQAVTRPPGPLHTGSPCEQLNRVLQYATATQRAWANPRTSAPSIDHP